MVPPAEASYNSGCIPATLSCMHVRWCVDLDLPSGLAAATALGTCTQNNKGGYEAASRALSHAGALQRSAHDAY
jgi:hypothetical protein